jgi:hypothetical protein
MASSTDSTSQDIEVVFKVEEGGETSRQDHHKWQIKLRSGRKLRERNLR